MLNSLYRLQTVQMYTRLHVLFAQTTFVLSEEVLRRRVIAILQPRLFEIVGRTESSENPTSSDASFKSAEVDAGSRASSGGS